MKCYEICYHEIHGRTIYVNAENREDAEIAAHKYFAENPLIPDDYLESTMDAGETDPRYLDKDTDTIIDSRHLLT